LHRRHLGRMVLPSIDRIDPARVFGSRYCLGRGTSAPEVNFLCRLLQLRQNASVFVQGCADFPSDSSDRNHSFTTHPWRTSSSLRPGLSFRYTQVAAPFKVRPLTPFQITEIPMLRNTREPMAADHRRRRRKRPRVGSQRDPRRTNGGGQPKDYRLLHGRTREWRSRATALKLASAYGYRGHFASIYQLTLGVALGARSTSVHAAY
jgi:hypothetical protein